MKINEKDDEIILRDTQYFSFIFGILGMAVFALSGVLFFSNAIKFPNIFFSLQGIWYRTLFKVLGFLFLTCGVCYALYKQASILLTPMITVRIKP